VKIQPLLVVTPGKQACKGRQCGRDVNMHGMIIFKKNKIIYECVTESI
jgi:hypothetical protein